MEAGQPSASELHTLRWDTLSAWGSVCCVLCFKGTLGLSLVLPSTLFQASGLCSRHMPCLRVCAGVARGAVRMFAMWP
jgi:hypothetical protein